MNDFQIKMAREVCFWVMDHYSNSWDISTGIKRGKKLEELPAYKAAVALGHVEKVDQIRIEAAKAKLEGNN